MATKYREVPLLMQSVVCNKRKSINVFSGAYHAMLVDSKTSEISGGIQLDCSTQRLPLSNRFIYWRTFRETIYLTETRFDRNGICHEIKITFEGSPILTAHCYKHSNSVAYIIIVTTTSIHRIPLEIPVNTDQQLRAEDSILLKLNESIITDPLNCYTFINDIGHALPVAATATHNADHFFSKIAIACSQSLYLFTMRMEGIKMVVEFLELDHNPLIFSKLIHTIADSWRRKTHTSQVVTMSFGSSSLAESQPLLYTLHQDGALRVWLCCGKLLTTEYISKYIQGGESEFHICLLRSSQTLVALYFSLQTFSEFILLRPEVLFDSVTGAISSLTINNVCTILAPNFELIDFMLCDQSLWSLWCNAKGETQSLVYEIINTKNDTGIETNDWSPVILENTSEIEHSTLQTSTDLKDIYCNRILQSGLFPDKVIKKTLMMFNRNLVSIAGSSNTSSMIRLKRYVFTSIESQLQQESASMRQKGPFDDEQMLEISNNLWEKFYQYCIQYRLESSRPVGLFVVEGQNNGKSYFTAGIIRKKYVSFFRTCERLEVEFHMQTSSMPVDSPAVVNECSLQEEMETHLLIRFLGEIELTLTVEQKHELDSYIHQRKEDRSTDQDLPFIAAAQNQLLIHNILPGLLQRIANLPRAIGKLLHCLKPVEKTENFPLWQEEMLFSTVGSQHELDSELILTTVKQTIQLRYSLLRNLLLVLHIVLRHCNLHYDTVDVMQSILRPETENVLRSYHIMNWIAQTRLDIDWTKTNKISSLFPLHLRTSMTLLQAYATSRMKQEISSWFKSLSSSSSIAENDIPLTLEQKTNIIIGYICPTSDDFLFGEWLSNNDLHVHIDEYVRLLSGWCEWNSCSRNFIKAKSCLALGDTFKALDLFPLSLRGIQNERFLKNFLCQQEKNRQISPCTTLTTFYLKLIRIFEAYGAHDGVIKLVHSGIDSTIQPKQQAMFQSIEFSCHIELGRFEDAYNTLTKNCDSARKKDCLRQLICMLFAMRRLDILLELPYYGLEQEFINIIGMNARSADVSDCIQYNFLYSFYVNKMNQRKAASTAYEEGLRNFLECHSINHLKRYYCCIMKCLNSLAILKPNYAWIIRPVAEPSEPLLSSMGDNKIEIVGLKKLEKQLITTHCALQLSLGNDGFKLVASLDPMNLISLMLKRKQYNLALKLSRVCAPYMVTKIYEHFVGSCITASSNISMPNTSGTTNNIDANNGLSWINESSLSDVAIVPDTASMAWKYLQCMIASEEAEYAIDAHLAVLNRILSRSAHVPNWLKNWCFEHAPVRLIRAYLCHGRLEEAYDGTLEMFRNYFFSSGRFSHQTLFPLTVCEYLIYELERSSKHSQERDQIERYMRIIEVAL